MARQELASTRSSAPSASRESPSVSSLHRSTVGGFLDASARSDARSATVGAFGSTGSLGLGYEAEAEVEVRPRPRTAPQRSRLQAGFGKPPPDAREAKRLQLCQDLGPPVVQRPRSPGLYSSQNYLHGLGDFTSTQNERPAHRRSVLMRDELSKLRADDKPDKRKGKAAAGPSFGDLAAQLEAAARSTLERHQLFSPNDDGKVALRDGAATRAASPDRQGSQMLGWRLRKFKYCRKIEKPVPPLTRCQTAPGRIRPPRDKIERNADPDVIALFSPERKKQVAAEANRLREERSQLCFERYCDEVEAKRVSTLQELQRKADQVNRRRRFPVDGAVASSEVLRFCQQLWLVLLMLVLATNTSKDHVEMKRLKLTELTSKAQGKTWAQLKRLATTSVLYQRVFTLVELERDPDVHKIAPFIQIWVAAKLKIRHRRATAWMVYAAMDRWATAGRILMSMRLFHHRVKRCQTWWRAKRKALGIALLLVRTKWQGEERLLIQEELAAGKHSSQEQKPERIKNRRASRQQHAAPAVTLSNLERIEVFMLEEKLVTRFLRRELRVRRVLVLAKMAKWHLAMDEYHEQVELWRATKNAYEALGVEEGEAVPKYPPMRPGCPSYLPSAAEIRHMILRCRKGGVSATTPLPTPSAPPEKDHMADATRMSKDMPELDEPEEPLLSARDYLPRLPKTPR